MLVRNRSAVHRVAVAMATAIHIPTVTHIAIPSAAAGTLTILTAIRTMIRIGTPTWIHMIQTNTWSRMTTRT